MQKVLTILFAGLLGIAAAAWAGEMEGKVQSVDSGERTVVLENGTKIWLGEGVEVDKLKEGARVKVSYQERDGKHVATAVEVTD
jgi:hypothetical protein